DAALVLIFLAEGAALGGLGWLLGLALGYPAGRLFTEQLGRVLFALGFMLSPGVVVASLLFTVGLSIVSSLGPALGAAQLRADAALRYE
ncbi:MAG: FtsX-like permease family protein, partial [Chloroflexi bacterium]|nr:FtsX-like permease family protein [Chloroflexota bacterium]